MKEKNILKLKFYGILFSFFLFLSCYTQEHIFYNDLALSHLLINNEAISGGMGETDAVPDDFSLSLIEGLKTDIPLSESVKFNTGISYSPLFRNLLNDINYFNAFYNFKKDKNILGLSVNYLSWGEITLTDEEGNFMGQYFYGSSIFKLTYRRLLGNSIFIDIQPKFLTDNNVMFIKHIIDDQILASKHLINSDQGEKARGKALAFDLGVNYLKDFQIGNSYYNWQTGLRLADFGSKFIYKSGSEIFKKDLPATLSFVTMLHWIASRKENKTLSFKLAYQLDALVIPYKETLDNVGEINFTSQGSSRSIIYINDSYEIKRHNPLHKIGTELKFINENNKYFAARIGWLAEQSSHDDWRYLTTGLGFGDTRFYFNIKCVLAPKDKIYSYNRTFSLGCYF